MLISFLKVPDWISSVQDGLMGSIVSGIRTFCFNFDTVVYDLIIKLYNLFEMLCKARLLDGEVISELSKRIGFILGMIMFFNVIFSFIQMLIEPDVLNDKERGAVAILKKSLLVIVMLGLSNFAFNTLYEVQKIIIDNHVISNLLLPYQVSDESIDNFGGALSSNLMKAFYQVESFDNVSFTYSGGSMVSSCTSMTTLFFKQIVNEGRFDLGYSCLNESITITYDESVSAVDSISEEDEVYIIDFNWVLSVIVGIVVAYFLLMYCFSVGVRMIQLAVLEIISPMAIISYLSPKKDTMFSKWTKIYFSTYIDVFIRIAIINFVVFLIAALFSSDSMLDVFWTSVGNPTDNGTITFFTVVLILALLTFAKKAPDLIKELFPAGASKIGFGGVGFKDMLGGNTIKKGLTTGAKMVTAGTAIGLIGGLTSATSRFRTNWKNGKGLPGSILGGAGGLVSGAARGVIAGGRKGNIFGNIAKGVTEQRNINDKYDELITSGGSVPGKVITQLSSYFGETKGQTYTRQLSELDSIDKFKKDIQGYADEISFVKSAKDAWEQTTRLNGESIDKYEKRKEAAYNRYKALRNGAIDAAISENTNDFTVNYIDENGNNKTLVKNLTAVTDDKLYASDIVAKRKEADGFVKSHRISYWDDATGSYKTTIDNRDDLSKAVEHAHKTRTQIYSEEDYNKSVANDKAAGVNSNGSKK